MQYIIKSQYSRWVAHGLIIIVSMVACTTIPSIDRSWIASNCTSVGYVRSDSGNQHKMSNGDTWEGPITNGKMHGLGTYTWAADGSYFHGEYKRGDRWCGVEARGSEFYVYKNGTYERGQAGVDWGTVAAAVIIGAAVGAAAASGGGGYSAPVRDYDWDWDAFYDQYYNLQWRCRGIQTGQFADDSNCAYDYKDDDRWPDK